MASNILSEAVRVAVGAPKTVDLLVSAAKVGAIAGAAAGAGVALVGGVAAASGRSGDDSYTVLGSSLSQIGNGAIVGALAASATGIGVAALVGRGLLTVAAPALVGTVAAAAVQNPVSRFTRDAADKLAEGLRARFRRSPVSEPVGALPGSAASEPPVQP
jgi:hypothetical protein